MSSPSPTLLESASFLAGASAAGAGAYHDGEDHAAHGAEPEIQGDPRILLCLCTASSALTLAALYSIASKLNLF